jgi:hypothetical protein
MIVHWTAHFDLIALRWSLGEVMSLHWAWYGVDIYPSSLGTGRGL